MVDAGHGEIFLAPHTLLQGQEGASYEIQALLGEGGFGQVYRARSVPEQGEGKEVALKLLQHLSDSAIERFRREFDTTHRLCHRAVVRSLDRGHTPLGKPFFVMEFCEGHELYRELSLRGGMPPGRAITLVCGALEGLSYAHAHGVVHKDLKPDNLFLIHPGQEDEHLKILDFGIAAAIDEPSIDQTLHNTGTVTYRRLTTHGGVVCTPAYAAPEYLQSRLVSPRLDVYQMGLILVEMLTGRPVVDSDLAIECVMAHVNGQLDIPEELLQGPLGPVISRAVAHNPNERFPRASAFARALRLANPWRDLHPEPTPEPAKQTAQQFDTIQTPAPSYEVMKARHSFFKLLEVTDIKAHPIERILELLEACIVHGEWKKEEPHWRTIEFVLNQLAQRMVHSEPQESLMQVQTLRQHLQHRLGRPS